MSTCPSCDEEAPIGVAHCPSCGAGMFADVQIRDAQTRPSDKANDLVKRWSGLSGAHKIIIIIIGVLLTALLAVVVIANQGPPEGAPPKPDAYFGASDEWCDYWGGIQVTAAGEPVGPGQYPFACIIL